MSRKFILAVIVLVLGSFACSLQNLQMQTIDPQWININEPLPGNRDETELVFKMTGGKFTLTPGADRLVNGHITYNVRRWEPEFIRRDNYFEIRQSNPLSFTGIPTGEVENQWLLELTNALPIKMTIEGGASENDFDLTGLQLTNLRIVQGASDTTIRFDAPNPEVMQEFIFTTGASSAKLFGLGHANFQRMTMSGGAGDYTLDFSGSLTQDATVDIKAGISNLTLVIPADMHAVINNKGAVSNINTRGTWLVTDNTYATLNEGFTLTINLDLAVGNINMVHQE